MTSSSDSLVEKVARAIWEAQTGGDWDARMSWYRATPDQKADHLKRGTHPDNFDYNDDVEKAFKAARAAIGAMREPTDRMWDQAENASVHAELSYEAGDEAIRAEAHKYPTARIWFGVVFWRAMIAAALSDSP